MPLASNTPIGTAEIFNTPLATGGDAISQSTSSLFNVANGYRADFDSANSAAAPNPTRQAAATPVIGEDIESFVIT